jgi:cysteine-rich repeat protein
MSTVRRAASVGSALSIILLTMCLGATPSYGQGILLGAAAVPGSGPSSLYRINPGTGAATLIGAIGFNGVTGLAFLPDGRLVASALGDGLFVPQTAILIQINPFDGTGTLIGKIDDNTVSGCGRMPDITYDATTGKLYGYGDFCVIDDSFYSINTTTGAGTLIGQTGFSAAGNGLAWEPSSNTIFATPSDDASLVTINPTTGVATEIPASVGNVGFTNALAFDPVSGNLFGSSSGNLHTINTTTGVTASVGVSQTGLDALIFSPLFVAADPNEPNNTFATATPITCNSTVTNAQISPLNDVDFYQVTVQEGTLLSVDIDAGILGSTLDTQIRVFTSGGSPVTPISDDNEAYGELSSFDSFLAVRLSAGTYLIGVDSFNDDSFNGSGGSTTGPYNMTVTCTQRIGAVVDNSSGTVTTFDADNDTILGSLTLGAINTEGDVVITPDRTRAFVTDFNSELYAIDITTVPPSLAGGTNPIPISNFGEDIALSADGKFLVTCDGAIPEPVSVVDIASQTEVHTLTLSGGEACNTVDTCMDGSVLVGSYIDGDVRRLTISGTGVLTDTGDSLTDTDGPNNVYCSPTSASGIVVNSDGVNIQSFKIPGLTAGDTRALSSGGAGNSGVIDAPRSRVLVRSNVGTDVVDVFSFNPTTDALGATPSLSIPITTAGNTYFGMEQMALHPSGVKLYVSAPTSLDIYNSNTGALITSITDPGFSQLTGVAISQCGNGVLDPGEQCDDGNLVDGDCCNALCQFETAGSPCDDGEPCTVDACNASGVCVGIPHSACLTGASDSFQVKLPGGAKNQIKWKLSKGQAFTQADLGDPTTTTTYRLCVYDTTTGVASLKTSLVIPPNATTWHSKDPKGLAYVDKAGAQDGVTKAQLKTGPAGKTKVQLSAKGTSLPAITPFSGTELYDKDPKVTVQLLNSATSTCWSTDFTNAKKNTATSFSAKAP